MSVFRCHLVGLHSVLLYSMPKAPVTSVGATSDNWFSCAGPHSARGCPCAPTQVGQRRCRSEMTRPALARPYAVHSAYAARVQPPTISPIQPDFRGCQVVLAHAHCIMPAARSKVVPPPMSMGRWRCR